MAYDYLGNIIAEDKRIDKNTFNRIIFRKQEICKKIKFRVYYGRILSSLTYARELPKEQNHTERNE